jgi:hypothetical protein
MELQSKPHDDDILEWGMYKGLPYGLIYFDKDYCKYILSKCYLPKEARKFQNWLLIKEGIIKND